MQSLGGIDDSSTRKVKVVNGKERDTNMAVDLIIYTRAKKGWRIDKSRKFPRTREW